MRSPPGESILLVNKTALVLWLAKELITGKNNSKLID